MTRPTLAAPHADDCTPATCSTLHALECDALLADVGCGRELVSSWGHLTFDRPLPLVRRDSLRPGDVVHSSHSGRRRVAEAYTLGTGVGTTYLLLEGCSSPEAYPGDSRMPLDKSADDAERDRLDALRGDPAHDEYVGDPD